MPLTTINNDNRNNTARQFQKAVNHKKCDLIAIIESFGIKLKVDENQNYVEDEEQKLKVIDVIIAAHCIVGCDFVKNSDPLLEENPLYFEIWSNLKSSNYELTEDQNEMIDAFIKREASVLQSTRIRSKKLNFTTDERLPIIKKLYLALRKAKDQCTKCQNFGFQNLCLLCWSALVKLFNLEEPVFSKLCTYEQYSNLKYDKDQRLKIRKDIIRIRAFTCNHESRMKICGQCCAKIRSSLTDNVKIVSSRKNHADGKHLHYEAANKFQKLIFSLSGCSNCYSRPWKIQHFSNPGPRHCDNCIARHKRILPVDDEYFVTYYRKISEQIKEMEKIEKQESTRIQKELKQAGKILDAHRREQLKQIEESRIVVNDPNTIDINRNRHRSEPIKASTSKLIVPAFKRPALEIIDELEDKNVAVQAKKEEIEKDLEELRDFLKMGVHQNENKELKKGALIVVQNLPNYTSMSTNKVRQQYNIGWERIHKTEKPIKEKHAELATFIVDHCSQYSTGTEDFCYTSSKYQQRLCTKANFIPIDNTTTLNEDNQVIKKNYNYKYKYNRHVMQHSKKSIFKKWKDHATNQLNNSQWAKISWQTFLFNFPYFVDSPKDKDIEHCICHVCFNFEKMIEHLESELEIRIDYNNPEDPHLDLIEELPDKEISLFQMREQEIEGQFNSAGKPLKKWRCLQDKFKKSEFIAKFKSELNSYAVHKNKVLADKKNWKDLKLRLLRKGYCVFHSDYAQDIGSLDKFNNQQSYMSGQRHNCLNSVVEYMGKKADGSEKIVKLYVAHVGDVGGGHDGQLWLQSIVDVVTDLQNLLKIKFTGLLLKSDNAASQFKCKYIYSGLYTVARILDIRKVLQVFGVPRHGKDEVDNVGGTIKSALRRQVAIGKQIKGSQDICRIIGEELPTTVHRMMYNVPTQHYKELASNSYKSQLDKKEYKLKDIKNIQMISLGNLLLNQKYQPNQILRLEQFKVKPPKN